MEDNWCHTCHKSCRTINVYFNPLALSFPTKAYPTLSEIRDHMISMINHQISLKCDSCLQVQKDKDAQKNKQNTSWYNMDSNPYYKYPTTFSQPFYPSANYTNKPYSSNQSEGQAFNGRNPQEETKFNDTFNPEDSKIQSFEIQEGVQDFEDNDENLKSLLTTSQPYFKKGNCKNFDERDNFQGFKMERNQDISLEKLSEETSNILEEVKKNFWLENSSEMKCTIAYRQFMDKILQIDFTDFSKALVRDGEKIIKEGFYGLLLEIRSNLQNETTFKETQIKRIKDRSFKNKGVRFDIREAYTLKNRNQCNENQRKIEERVRDVCHKKRILSLIKHLSDSLDF